jgi:4'-phosphopantetheinyl transferase
MFVPTRPVSTAVSSRTFGAARAELGADEVRIFIARPGCLEEAHFRARLEMLLRPDERMRAARFHFSRDRELYLLARGIVRLALGEATGIEPPCWQFRITGEGQPVVASPRSAIRFSISHTAGMVACALSHDRAVGVDVEGTRRQWVLSIADQFFSTLERGELATIAPDEQPARFFEYWTLKEAYAKARGQGFHLPFERIAFRSTPGFGWRLAASDDGDQPLDDWHVASWKPGCDHQIAVASCDRATSLQLCLYELHEDASDAGGSGDR